MKNRRTFLIASGAAGFAAMLARSDRTTALAETAKPPSEFARSVAATMRRFDPNLSAGELATIAHGVDDANVASAALRTKRRPLRNGEEPVTSFVVPFD